MLLFLIGIRIFYGGEAVHRDNDLHVEGLLWSHPVPNYVILSAKFLSTLLLVFGLILAVGVIAIVLPFVKDNTPLELSAYLNVYSLILVPNAIFLCTTCLLYTCCFLVDILLTPYSSECVLRYFIFTHRDIPARFTIRCFSSIGVPASSSLRIL
jgi:hypothetical protein